MNVNSVKPGNIVKYDIPFNSLYDDEEGTKVRVFEVKAVKDGKMYGQELQDIDNTIDRATHRSGKSPKFEVIA